MSRTKVWYMCVYLSATSVPYDTSFMCSKERKSICGNGNSRFSQVKKTNHFFHSFRACLKNKINWGSIKKETHFHPALYKRSLQVDWKMPIEEDERVKIWTTNELKIPTWHIPTFPAGHTNKSQLYPDSIQPALMYNISTTWIFSW